MQIEAMIAIETTGTRIPAIGLGTMALREKASVQTVCAANPPHAWRRDF
jgi:diketogulonate reductase-like aldo/keto reductase